MYRKNLATLLRSAKKAAKEQVQFPPVFFLHLCLFVQNFRSLKGGTIDTDGRKYKKMEAQL
jgi:hypothetical protein